MRRWTTPGADSTDSRACATRSKHPTSNYSARARHVHGTTQAARSGSLPCSLGSASAPHGCPVPWVLPGDHVEQDRTTGGKCGRLSGRPRVTKIELRKTLIFLFGRLYIARSRSPTPTTFVTRVVRVWKDAIEPPTVGQVYSKLPDSKPSSPESPYGTGLYPHLYSCTCTRVQ